MLMQQHRCNQAQPHCKQFRGFQASLNAMSGLIIYHWMPGVHTHSPNTGSLCYMGLDWNVWPLCLEVTKRAMNISFGSRHSLSQSWEEKQSTVHTRSPCTTCTTGSRWNMGLECLHVCMCHVQNISQRRSPEKTSSGGKLLMGQWPRAGKLILTRYLFRLLISVRISIDFDPISASTPDIGEDCNSSWLGFKSPQNFPWLNVFLYYKLYCTSGKYMGSIAIEKYRETITS